MNSARKNGFTLIEAMVVIAVLGIVLAIAAPSFTQMLANQRISSTTSTLQSALAITRSEALKRNTNITFAPTSPSQWNSGWTVTLPDGTVLFTYNAVPNVTITCASTAIVFQGSGRVSGAGDQTFQISADNTSLLKCVSIGLTGLPAVTAAGC